MRRKIAVAWVGAQVLFFGTWAATEQWRLGTGVSILVRTAPVDPRDLLRGQYLALSYEFSRVPLPADDGAEVWYVLRPEGEFHVPHEARPRRPDGLGPGQVAVRGRMSSGRVLYGVEEYYVPEGSSTPEPRDTTVRLRVGGDGRLRIETVRVRGKPWP